MSHPLLPGDNLKIVATGTGGYHLLMHHPLEDRIITVAEIFPLDVSGVNAAELYALLFAGSPTLLRGISELLEVCQPDGWDESTEQGQAWRRAFDAYGRAQRP